MKPEGRKTVKFPNKRDVHPKKGWVNWWETIASCIGRSVRKQKLRKEIKNEIVEYKEIDLNDSENRVL